MVMICVVVFWVMTLCCGVVGYQCFMTPYSEMTGYKCMQHGLLKHWYPTTTLHIAITQNDQGMNSLMKIVAISITEQ
jgi:hypothetical protein